MTEVVLGVDGGNTKTLGLVAGIDGTVLGVGRAGCADIHNAAAPDHAIGEIGKAVSSALSDAGRSREDVMSAAFSLAGADWPEDVDFLRDQLGTDLPAAKPIVVNDAIGVLRCGSPRWVGVAVAVGTYAAIGSRNAHGEVFHRGWWPDSMGGEPIANAALNAVYRADLGLGPATALTPAVFGAFGVDCADELLYRFNRRGVPRTGHGATLTPIALDVAAAGDGVAIAIVREQAQLIGAAARVSANRVGLKGDDNVLVVGGGVLAHPSSLLADGISKAAGVSRTVRTSSEPAVGAVALALDALGAHVATTHIAATLGGR